MLWYIDIKHRRSYLLAVPDENQLTNLTEQVFSIACVIALTTVPVSPPHLSYRLAVASQAKD